MFYRYSIFMNGYHKKKEVEGKMQDLIVVGVVEVIILK